MEPPASRPFVGRTRERALVRHLIRDAAEGRSAVVVVSGVAGAGKTALGGRAPDPALVGELLDDTGGLPLLVESALDGRAHGAPVEGGRVRTIMREVEVHGYSLFTAVESGGGTTLDVRRYIDWSGLYAQLALAPPPPPTSYGTPWRSGPESTLGQLAQPR